MSVVELSVRARSGRHLRTSDIRWELFVFPEVLDVRRLGPGLVGVHCRAEPRVRAWCATLDRLGYEVDVHTEVPGGDTSATAA
jgi:hypothetical protein